MVHEEIREGKFKGAAHRLQDEENVFDVVVAGAGPCGAASAFYLSKLGKSVYAGAGLRVALLDKASFPRDKYCGDAWCAPALDILEDMGVLQELEKDGLVVDCLSGGFVSPAGHSFIANDRETAKENKNMSTRCYAIKRMICDERIARKAASCEGVSLFENACVDSTVLNEKSGIWTITCMDKRTFKCRMLVAADGASSNIARKLGIVNTAPEGVACRRYVKGGTHNFKADGVLLYPEYTLPGYAALFRHYDDSIDLGAYFLPGGRVKEEDVADVYENELMADPFISRALGPNVEFAERLKVASLRLGGVERSYGEHVVLVGDAAGQVDPLTGEGIHTGMEGGKIAASVIVEMFRQGNFSSSAGKVYHKKWWQAFGKDFPISAMAGKVVNKLPFLMDAVPVASASKGGKEGSDFFADFGAVMTGVKPKTTFLSPSVAIPLMIATAGQFVKQFITRSERTYMQDPGILIDKELKRVTSWDAQCIMDISAPVGIAKASSDNLDSCMKDIFKYSNACGTCVPVLVMYGTEYGYSKELAEMLCQSLKLCEIKGNRKWSSFSPRCVNMAQHKLIKWDKEMVCLFVCSTAGDGVPPVEARDFFTFLKNDSSDCTLLERAKCAVLALGDVAYPHFCQAGKDLATLLEKLKVDPISSSENDTLCFLLDGDNNSLAEEWIHRVGSALQNLFSSPEDHFVNWLNSLYVESKDDGDVEYVDYLISAVKENANLFSGEIHATKTKPYLATVESVKELTTREYDDDKDNPKEVWHITLDISKNDGVSLLAYEPGDAIGVIPQNNPEAVKDILKVIMVDGNENIDGIHSVYEYLLNKCDLMKVPTKIFDALCIIPDSEENSSSSELHLIDVLEKYQDEVKRLSMNERISMIQNLNKIQPRFYSIASSPLYDIGKINICVAAVRYKTLGRNREGLASCFLIDRSPVGSELQVFIQRNPDFRMPTESTTPKIMIGPGTGVAPFMSFIRHESMLNEKGQSVLFFGSRHQKADFLYGKELEEWGQNKNSQLITAFSRDQDEKVYVQHRIAEPETSRKLWKLIQANGQIYICGDGWSMASDVRKALETLVQRESTLSESEVKNLLDLRIHLDVWVT